MSNITADEYSLLEFISSRDKQEDNSRILLEQTKKILKIPRPERLRKNRTLLRHRRLVHPRHGRYQRVR